MDWKVLCHGTHNFDENGREGGGREGKESDASAQGLVALFLGFLGT